jgi:hypothetical protein
MRSWVAVRRGTPYDVVATGLAPLVATGRLAAVLVEEDEGVLVGNRLDLDVPVVDQVDVSAVLAADLVAVEVTRLGRPLQLLSDPLRLGRALGLREDEIGCAARLAPHLFDATNAVVALGVERRGPRDAPSVGSMWPTTADSRSGQGAPPRAVPGRSEPHGPSPCHPTRRRTTSTTSGPSTWPQWPRRCRRDRCCSSRPVTVAALFRDVYR